MSTFDSAPVDPGDLLLEDEVKLPEDETGVLSIAFIVPRFGKRAADSINPRDHTQPNFHRKDENSKIGE